MSKNSFITSARYIDLRNVAWWLFYPQQWAKSEPASSVHAVLLLTWRHRDENSKWRYICVYGTAKALIRYWLNPFWVRIVSLFPLVIYICGMLLGIFFTPISESASSIQTCQATPMTSSRQEFWTEIYMRYGTAKRWIRYCLTPFCVRIVSLLPLVM